MRRTAVSLAVIVLAATLGASPASAAFGTVVQLPASAVYSPYGGPATVTFTFDPGDPAPVFTVRIRRPGHAAIREKDYLVDPGTQMSPHPVSFSWKDLSVSAPTDYVVDVRRQGGPVITNATFTLLPKLVSGLSAAPSPFYPLVQDGYKDHTTIGFALAADTVDTVAHVFGADPYGRCCGGEIRTDDLGPLAAGAHGWIWDGTRDDASPAPKGTYFVRIGATDADAISDLSKAQSVAITKGSIRKTSTKHKLGSAYARAAGERETRRGGDCGVARNTAAHTAEILCVNAEFSVYWRWGLKPGERIESASFKIDGGYYGCHKAVDHTKTSSILHVHAPPTSSCSVISATIRYSYPVQA